MPGSLAGVYPPSRPPASAKRPASRTAPGSVYENRTGDRQMSRSPVNDSSARGKDRSAPAKPTKHLAGLVIISLPLVGREKEPSSPTRGEGERTMSRCLDQGEDL